jgi:hypothetical protein
MGSRAGGEKSDERGDCFFAGAEDAARVDQCDRYRKADVENERDRAKGGPHGKRLAREKWNLNMEAGVEGEKVEIKNSRMNRGSPVKQIVGKIFRIDEEKRRNKTEEQ